MNGDTVHRFSNNLCFREAAVEKHEHKNNQNTQRQSFHFLRLVHLSRENNPLRHEINRHDLENVCDPTSEIEGHSKNYFLGNPMRSSPCGFCPTISTWSNAAHCILIVKRKNWLRRKINSHYCSRDIFQPGKNSNSEIWQRLLCRNCLQSSPCDLKAWNHLISKLRDDKNKKQTPPHSHTHTLTLICPHSLNFESGLG